MRVVLVGNPREAHVGRHFVNAAEAAGVEVVILDLMRAYAGLRWLKTIFWRLLGRRPMQMGRFSANVVVQCKQWDPDLLLSTGIAPLSEWALKELRKNGVPTANFLTDDPWNNHHYAPWFMKALPHYEHVFTPRRANMPELQSLGGPQVHYLPFAYAPDIHFPPEQMSDAERAKWRSEVLFIGGADTDRAKVMRALQVQGFKTDLWGGYWECTKGMQSHARGHAMPEAFRRLVANAAVNLCLVRRANRDGHSMRTFELPAVGGCMVVEDTEEHREIFGTDGDCVRYFTAMEQLGKEIRNLLAHPRERDRMALAVRKRISMSDQNTYATRLRSIVGATLAPTSRQTRGA